MLYSKIVWRVSHMGSYLSILRSILEGNIRDLLSETGRKGKLPLHVAAEKGMEVVVAALLEAGNG